MAAELQIFNVSGVNGYQEDGVVYIRLEDAAFGLGFSQTRSGKDYVRWETVFGLLKKIGFSQEVGKDGFIPENVFYRLAMKAKNENAEKFQALVADEIIPSIRKHGAYLTPQVTNQILNNPDFLISLANKIKEEQTRNRILMEENTDLRTRNEELKPKALFAESVAASNSEITVGTLAKLLRQNGVKIGRNRLFEFLRAEGYLMRDKVRDRNLPTQKSMELGLFRVKETTIHANDEIIVSCTPYVTGKGQTYFIDRFLNGAAKA